MISQIYHTFLYVPILNLLIALYQTFNNFGVAIIVMTAILRVIMYPLSKPSMEAAKKQRELKPQIDALKKKYKNKQVFAQKQMELFKEHGINPAAGCLPQIVPLVVILTLYKVFRVLLADGGSALSTINDQLYNIDFIRLSHDAVLNLKFLYLDLSAPDPIYLLPVLAAGAQFFMSRYMLKSTASTKEIVKDTPDKSDDVMYNMQQQMMYLMPIMTIGIGIRLPSGLVLYWFVSNLLALFQYRLLNRPASSHGK